MLLPQSPFSKGNHFGLAIHVNTLRGIYVNANNKVITQVAIDLKEPIFDGQNINQNAIIDGLKQIYNIKKFPTNYVAVCFPEKLAFSREYVLPQLSASEIADAVYWQIEKIFPFNRDEIYTDWRLLNKKDQNIRVSVVAIQKSILDSLKQSILACRLHPISFESSASALSRLAPSTENAIITELESSGTSSTLVVNGVASLTITTLFKHNTSPNQVLEDIVSSIKRLTQRTNSLNNNLPKIVITGEKANQQISQVIQQQSGLNVEVLNIPQVEPGFHLAYAAAKNDVFNPDSEKSINLLPVTLQEKYRAIFDKQLVHTIIKWSLVLIFPAMLLSLMVFIFTQFQISQLMKQKKLIPTETAGNVNIASLQRKSLSIISLFPKKTTPQILIEEIITNTPSSVVLNNMNVDQTKKIITLSGVAKIRQDVFDFKTKLEETKKFKNISIPLNVLETAENTKFSLEIGLLP